MGTRRRRFAAASLLLAATLLTGCGGGAMPDTAALTAASLPKSQARLKIYRLKGYEGLFEAQARLKVDGRELPPLGNGEVRIVDVAPGPHQIVVDDSLHPNVFKLDVHAKAGTVYDLEVSTRDEAAVAGAVLGLTGMLIEAAANENGGAWQVRLVKEGPTA